MRLYVQKALMVDSDQVFLEDLIDWDDIIICAIMIKMVHTM